MASRKLTSHRLYPVQVSPSYAQPNIIPSPSFHLHMPSQGTYPAPCFILILPAEDYSQFKLFVRAVTLTVHLHFIPDVDIHLHHLHVHSTRPLPGRDVPLVHRHPTVLRVTRLLLPPTRGPLDEGQESEACTSPGQYFASLIIN